MPSRRGRVRAAAARPLMLHAAFEVGERGLPLVRVGHRQHHVDRGIVRHRLSGGHRPGAE